jgi:hypothetical protein
VHSHFCLACGDILATGDFDCEYDDDHDFALCDTCAEQEWRGREYVRDRLLELANS